MMCSLPGGTASCWYDGSGFAVLAYWPPAAAPDGATCMGGTRIVRLRGLSPSEVFLAVTEVSPTGECPQRPFLLRWDGSAFHWM